MKGKTRFIEQDPANDKIFPKDTPFSLGSWLKLLVVELWFLDTETLFSDRYCFSSSFSDVVSFASELTSLGSIVACSSSGISLKTSSAIFEVLISVLGCANRCYSRGNVYTLLLFYPVFVIYGVLIMYIYIYILHYIVQCLAVPCTVLPGNQHTHTYTRYVRGKKMPVTRVTTHPHTHT